MTQTDYIKNAQTNLDLALTAIQHGNYKKSTNQLENAVSKLMFVYLKLNKDASPAETLEDRVIAVKKCLPDERALHLLNLCSLLDISKTSNETSAFKLLKTVHTFLSSTLQEMSKEGETLLE